jgi:predicted TIM-barrel fold metal-dependent hydrolase
MIVDVHTHIWGTKVQYGVITAERVLQAMDEAEIDKAVLLPALSTGKIPSAKKVAEEVRRAPDRLVGFAAVNPKEKDATTKSEEAVVKYGVRGFKIHPIFQALPADDEIGVYPFIERAQGFRIHVMFHSGETPYATPWHIGLVLRK